MKNKKNFWLYTLLLTAAIFALAGCGAEPAADQPPPPATEPAATVQPAPSEPTATPQVIVVVVTATAESQIPTAAVEVAETDAAQPAATEQPPTAPPPTATTAAVPPTNAAPTCGTNVGLRLRAGPGESYNILGTLPGGASLTPQAFVAAGFPGGSWLLVTAGSQQGWVSANPQFVTCNVNPASLPAPGAIPPTATPLPTAVILPSPTPPAIAVLPINIGQPARANVPDAGEYPVESVEWRLETNPTFLFRFYIRLKGGDRDGAGIDSVHFQIKDGAGNVVHERREGTAGYCVFGGGEPVCNPWVVEDGVYKWRSTGLTVEDGDYDLVITVDPKDNEDTWTWFLGDFPVDVP